MEAALLNESTGEWTPLELNLEDPEELAQTTMDPARRMLVRVEVEDAAAADQVFSMLMGDQVEPRREFIEQNARNVKFLDI